MPIYRIKQREIHESTFEVEATDIADAIDQVWNGDVEIQNLEFIEVDETVGLDIYKDMSDDDRAVLQRKEVISEYSRKIGGIVKVEVVGG